ncbi:MAG: response regulator [Candidatus Binataceae bacterium]
MASLEKTKNAWEVRAGALLIVAYQLAYLKTDLALPHPASAYLVPVHLFSLLIGLTGFALSCTRSGMRRWQALAFAICGILVVTTTWISLITLETEPLFVSDVLFCIAAGSLLAVGWIWQLVFTLLCLGSFSVHVAWVPSGDAWGVYRWLGLLAAAGLAQFTTVSAERYRKNLSRKVVALSESHQRLRSEIAEREKTEQKLRESEAKFRHIFGASLEAIGMYTYPERKIVDVNEEYLRKLGLSRDEVIGKTTAELKIWANPADWVGFGALLNQQGFVRNYEASFRTKDGTLGVGQINASVFELGGDRFVVISTRDITELKQAQRELRESEAKFRHIFESSLDGISIITFPERKILDVNDEYLRRLGYSRDEVVGKTSAEFKIWAEEEDRLRFGAMLAQQGFVRNYEATFRAKDGTLGVGQINASVFELGGDKFVVISTRDITELKQVQHELIATREAALAASRAKSEFLSSMSHEIRTPMNAILGMSDLLCDTPLNSEQQRYVNMIRTNGDALLELINGILDLAKVESGRMSLELADFDLNQLIETLLETHGLRAHEKGLELAARVLPDVPLTLIGDPLRLSQILVNLLGNAIKFTKTGEVVLTVEREPDSAGSVGLRFSVSDTGIGIPTDKLQSIFASFTQADSSTTRRYGGSGLGLAIAQGLVALMDGKIWVESEVGKGSTFFFTARFDLQTKAPSLTRRSASVDLRDVPVLVVDDNATNRLILRELLSRAGATVREAADGEQALAEFERAREAGKPFELLLLDCMMPGMDGFEVAQRVRTKAGGSNLIILMLTSDSLTPKLARLRELGLDAYLVKPIRRAELFSAIASAIGNIAVHELQTRQAARQPTQIAGQALPFLRILLADDSLDNRFLIEAYLAKAPCKLDMAENGEIALNKLTSRRYDLVLMDIQMPVMDGYTAVRAYRQWEREHQIRPIRIFALTASALQEDARKCIEAGCDAHLTKPIKKAALLEAIFGPPVIGTNGGAPQPL